ncbi:DUF4350 domain-containing protein [Curtobacterium pusillum]|uniref:DUF4350 domain-containing protein n=1 Tax=Curtobacterium pusillum TaxID=69373 RepID=UPI0011A6E4FF|nr:DUF4350 domain-containing protein [Curtobacterium pusillum]
MTTTATTATTPATAERPTDRTPPHREGRGLRIGFWVAIVLVGLLLAALTAVAQRTGNAERAPLDPGSATASGTKALVRVLEQQGTDVRIVARADRIADGTVLVDDSQGALDPAVARRLARQSAHVVLVTTDPRALEAFGLDVEPAAQADDDRTVSTAACPIPAAAEAERITATGTGFAVPDGERTPAGTDLCAATGSGDQRTYGLVRTATPAGDVTLVGTTAALRNDTITTAGNAALALALLGGDETLTWYTPISGAPDAAPTLGSLAPPWVPSVLGLLGLVAVAAGIWRGRRLGPLVVERMPVVVRAAETTEGRARLAARTRDRTHALDTLRVAALRRTARRLGLPRSAHVDEVVRAAAHATGIPHQRVGAVLVGGPTHDDRALVAGAAALDELEQAVLAATTGDRHTDRDHRGARP